MTKQWTDEVRIAVRDAMRKCASTEWDQDASLSRLLEGDFFDEMTAVALAEAAPTKDDGPQLGLATTEELLIELRSRGITENLHRHEGTWIMNLANRWLQYLSPCMLSYRTVDGHTCEHVTNPPCQPRAIPVVKPGEQCPSTLHAHEDGTVGGK